MATLSDNITFFAAVEVGWVLKVQGYNCKARHSMTCRYVWFLRGVQLLILAEHCDATHYTKY